MDEMTNRELDASVAVLLGWTGVQPDAYTPYGRDACGTIPNATDTVWGQGRRAIPHYSTDIAAAWLVIAAFNDYDVKLYSHGEGWTFVIYKDATHYEGSGTTPMLAICRAALTIGHAQEKEG